jgi:hypothetical protein
MKAGASSQISRALKMTIEVYYEQLCPHKCDDLDGMDQFLKDIICQNVQKKKQAIQMGLY